jgi:hypothetical protein
LELCEEELDLGGLSVAIEVVGAEVLVERAVGDHVVGGREDRGGDGSDGLLSASA